jgi:hypothetical protein
MPRKIKILWLYKYLPNYDFDNWLHMKFAEAIREHSDLFEIECYGPDIHIGYPHMTKWRYDESITMDKLRKDFKYDIVIANTKSRMYFNYDPYNKIADGDWTPKGFDTCSAPKVMIEEDAHYEKSGDWYQQHKYNLIMQRHYIHTLKDWGVQTVWLPFSVDIDTFKPFEEGELGSHTPANKLAFIGSANATAYKPRWDAMHALHAKGMIDILRYGEMKGKNYPHALKTYVGFLSCASIYKLTSAKMFEIMSAGGALLTNKNRDLQFLFPDDIYYTYHPENKDVIHIAEEMLSNRVATDKKRLKGMKFVREHHNHTVRINQLHTMLSSLLDNQLVKGYEHV